MFLCPYSEGYKKISLSERTFNYETYINNQCSKKPRADSIVNFRSISIRERFLRLLFGIPCKMTILVPGDSVEKLSICEVNKEGRR